MARPDQRRPSLRCYGDGLAPYITSPATAGACMAHVYGSTAGEACMCILCLQVEILA